MADGRFGGQSVKGITIFMEGGGSALGSAAIRQGMGDFLASVRGAAQKKRITWKLVPCGSREDTFARFRDAVVQARESMAHILLVDAEAVVTGTDPRIHLRNQDGWDLTGVPVDAIHLMVQIMETWIVADPKALTEYYGRGFVEAKLPKRANLEEEPKKRVLDALKDATRRTAKRDYDKIKHAAKLLGRIDPERVQARCRHCKRCFEALERIVAAAR